MNPWKLVVGAAVGAVLVKESQKAGALYDSIRVRFIAAVKRVQELPQVPDAGSGVTPEEAGPA